MALSLPLNNEVVAGFVCGRVLTVDVKEAVATTVNSLDFHRTADLLVTANNAGWMHVYSTVEGREVSKVPSLKYGCQGIVWTHEPDKLVFASDKGEEHSLRYLHMDGARATFLQYFRGHTGRVTKVAMNPKTDTFLTAGQDNEVRLWDLRTPQCQALLQTPCAATVAFDQQGLVFAVGLNSGIIKLYDAKQYEQGPFETFVVPGLQNSPAPFTHLAFSNDGKLLLAVAEGSIFVLDAFSGEVLRSFSNGVAEPGAAAPEASLSYDGEYVLSGCDDRAVRVWSVSSGTEVAAWQGHPALPACAKWAPRRLLAASACGAVCLWVPGPDVVNAQLAAQQQQQPQQQHQVLR